MKDAEAGQPVELTRHGERVAVIVSAAEYDRLTTKKPDFWEAYKEWRKKYNAEELDLDPDEIYGGIRDRSPGRKVDL